MSKRFTDTEKFNDKWYRKLPILQKVIWEYLLSECNHAGILEKFDIELMSFKIGAEVTNEDLRFFKDRIIFISDSVLYIPKFIKFQYGELNPQNKVHASVLKEFERWGIQAPSKGLASPFQGAKDKNKEKNNTTTISNQIILGNEYQNVCLTKEQYDKLLTLCISEKLLNELVNSFSINIEVGKERPYEAKHPNAHYERLKSYYKQRKMYPERYRNTSPPPCGENKAVEKTKALHRQWEQDRIEAEKNPVNIEEYKKKLTFLSNRSK